MINESQINKANNLSWYHALKFDNYRTAGRFPESVPGNHTLFGALDILDGINVEGLRVLEIGPGHGLISFGLALQKADVTVVNIGGGKPPQWLLAEELYGLNIDYKCPVPLEKINEVFKPATFDLIVCCGVMYHLLNPADVFFRTRPLLKNDGLLLVESAYIPSEKNAVLRLNSVTEDLNQPTTYFLPSESAIKGLSKLACLDVMATRENSPGRFTILSKSTSPDQVKDRSDLCKEMHRLNFEDPAFDLNKINNSEFSNISFKGDCGHKIIDVRKFQTSFPTQPIGNEILMGKSLNRR